MDPDGSPNKRKEKDTITSILKFENKFKPLSGHSFTGKKLCLCPIALFS